MGFTALNHILRRQTDGAMPFVGWVEVEAKPISFPGELAWQLEYLQPPPQVSGTPRTRVLKGLHLLRAGEVPGKPTSV